MNCEKCNKEFIPTKSSKRFCSLSCANSRKWNFEDRKKKSDALKAFNENKPVKSLWEYSGRTVTKILKRANMPCQNCGYCKATRDVHHIVARKDGGTNDNSNLIILCPNCHREAHEGFINLEDLKSKSVDITFKNYLDYYLEGYGGIK